MFGAFFLVYLKESGHCTNSIVESSWRHKKRRGGTNFSKSKEKRYRKSKKKVAPSVMGRGTISKLSERDDFVGRFPSRLDCTIRKIDLDSIEEGVNASSELSSPSMANRVHGKDIGSDRNDFSNMDLATQRMNPAAQ